MEKNKAAFCVQIRRGDQQEKQGTDQCTAQCILPNTRSHICCMSWETSGAVWRGGDLGTRQMKGWNGDKDTSLARIVTDDNSCSLLACWLKENERPKYLLLRKSYSWPRALSQAPRLHRRVLLEVSGEWILEGMPLL